MPTPRCCVVRIGGQHLTHVAVLRELVRVGAVAPGAASHQSFSVALRPDLARTPLRIIAFVQQSGLGTVLGVAEQTTGP